LDEIPDLYTGDPKTPRSDERWIAMHDYLREVHGVKICHIVIDRWSPFKEKDMYIPWLTEPHTITGHNLDGVPHMVVGFKGEMIWDPNPQRRGLVDMDGIEFLLGRALMTQEFWDLPYGLTITMEDV
tara:strand:+ start:4258 stop:4638 length:381 start_codon:yes stop_codon:yes gene_type:complete